MSGNRPHFTAPSVAQHARKERVVTLRICGESLAIRHVDAGYPEAIALAKEKGVKVPMGL